MTDESEAFIPRDPNRQPYSFAPCDGGGCIVPSLGTDPARRQAILNRAMGWYGVRPDAPVTLRFDDSISGEALYEAMASFRRRPAKPTRWQRIKRTLRGWLR